MKAPKILLAAGIGFLAGLLLAPKSGRETREELKNRADDLRGKATEKTEQVKGAMRDGYHSLRSGADDLKDQAKDFAGSVKNSAGRVADEAKSTATEARQRANTARATIKETSDNVRSDTRRNTR